VAVLSALLLVAYPLAIYLALQHASPRAVAIGAIALLGARSLLLGRNELRGYARAWASPAAGLAIVFALAALWNDRTGLLAAPALASLSLLATFGLSLRAGRESVVEQIARVQLGKLTPEDERYCRRVTTIWCAFFVANALVALGLAAWASLATWALYTGLVAYLLIAALFSAEYVYRSWRFRRYFGAPTDIVFRRLFPPRAE
jgi:uncharacterized membrane protein